MDNFTYSLVVYKGSYLSTSWPVFIVTFPLVTAILIRVILDPNVILVGIFFLPNSEIMHFLPVVFGYLFFIFWEMSGHFISTFIDWIIWFLFV